jgi:hypothetical protein
MSKLRLTLSLLLSQDNHLLGPGGILFQSTLPAKLDSGRGIHLLAAV